MKRTEVFIRVFTIAVSLIAFILSRYHSVEIDYKKVLMIFSALIFSIELVSLCQSYKTQNNI